MIGNTWSFKNKSKEGIGCDQIWMGGIQLIPGKGVCPGDW